MYLLLIGYCCSEMRLSFFILILFLMMIFTIFNRRSFKLIYIMGDFLSSIKGEEVRVDQELLHSSHSKLVEYYSSYKSICEGYTINVPEYTHIFGPSQLSFEVWDIKKRGKIDAIQMFTGLIIFSNVGFEQKMKFLFEVFDFNEEGFLCYENIALMLINACNATYKVFLMEKTIQNSTIELFLDEYFTQESEVSYHQLLRWTLRIPQFGQYFKTIGHEIQQLVEQKQICEISCQEYDGMVQQKTYFSQNGLSLDDYFMKKLSSFFVKSEQKLDIKEKREMLNLQVDWVFGINCRKENIKYLCSQGLKAANERVIYTVGKVIIVYYPKLNIQQYYKQHRQSISVIEISSKQKLVASGEQGDYPQIHIWDMETKKTLVKFKKLHKDSISFLKFFKNDKQLITASQTSALHHLSFHSPFVVINLQTLEIIMSTYLQSEILGFIFNHDFPLKSDYFVVISSEELSFFCQNQDTYQMDTKQIKIKEPIVSFAYNSKGMLVTGHTNRKLYKWDQKFSWQPIVFVSNYQRSIKEMAFLGDQQLIIMDESDIEVIRFQIDSISRIYTLRLRETGLFSSRLLHMQKLTEQGLLVVSEFGDIFKVSQLNHFQKPVYHKYFQLFRLLSPVDYGEVSQSKSLIVSGRCLYLFDRYEKQLCALARFDYQLEKVECNKDSIIVLGMFQEIDKTEKSEQLQKNKIILVLSPTDLKIRESYKVQHKSVAAMKLSQNYLLLFGQNYLAVFHQEHQKFFQKKPNVYLNQTFGQPLSVVPTVEKQVFVFFNMIKEMWKFTLGSHSQVDIKKIEKQSQFFQMMSSELFDISKESGSFHFCADLGRKLFALTQNNGDILIWESMKQALSHQSSPLRFHLHEGRISKILIKDNGMVSLGSEDGMTILFKHKKYIETPQTEPFVDESSYRSSQMMDQMIQKSKESNCTDPVLEGPVVRTEDLGNDFLKESKVEIQPLSDEHTSDLKKIIEEILHPKDQLQYQAQSKEQPPFSNEPHLYLTIEGIYGFSSKNSFSVFYVHSYTKEPEVFVPISSENQIENSMNKMKSEDTDHFHFSKTVLLPLDDCHLGCNRSYFYATDRLCVLRERKENKQKIYEFHRRKVTCVAIHPDKQIVISCEENTGTPSIHVWDTDRMATKTILSTRHLKVITRATFSRDGEWIATLGGEDREQSIQVTGWRDQEEISFKLIEGQVLRDIVFNPYERRQISVVGWQVIKVYQYKAGIMMLTDQCRAMHDFQVVTYTSSVYGDSIESDLIVGNSTGDLGIFICGKYIGTKEHAHNAAISCLRIAQLFGYKRVLITGGADSVVKIWDIKFNELSYKNIQQELYSFKIGEDRPDCKITSLDVYQCLKGKGADQTPTLLLISTSDGSVLEATIHNEFQGYQTRSLATQQIRQLKEKINFDLSLIFAAPSCLPSTSFTIFESLMVTFNPTSPFLQFWNLKQWERSLLFKLPEPPVLVTFMNGNPILMVAYNTLNYFNAFEIEFENSLVKGLKQLAEISLPKGHGKPSLATFAKKDNRLALFCISDSDINEVLFFSKDEQKKDWLTFKGKVENIWVSSFMQFSSNGEVLMVAWTDQKRANSFDQDYTIKCYNSDTQEELPPTRFDFRRFDFSKKIKASYIPCYQLGRFEKDSILKYSIKVTTMAQYDRYLLLGTHHGEVLVVESSFFGRNEKKMIRNFILCDSAITALEIRDDILYLASELGESVLKVKITLEQPWNMPTIIKDRYSSSLSLQTLQYKIKNVYSKRRKMQTEEKDSDCVSKLENGSWLKLVAVIGRNAFSKRNNIFVTLKDQILCFSGCNILVNKYHPGKQLEQMAIKPDPTPGSIHPEISSMALAEDKRLLVVGTAEQESKLLLWNISTNTYLTQIPLPTFVTVLIIKISLSSRKAAVLAATSKFVKNLLFIDLQQKIVQGVYRLIDLEINDICFAGSEECRILGCGLNFMGEWAFKNGILMPKKYSLGNSQDLLNLKSTGIIFYSLIFIEDMAISSSSDGYLYIWKEGKLAKKQNAHPGHEVLSLYAANNSKVFASGGTNGKVVIWKVWSSLIIQHQGDYPKQGSLKYPIQAISMTRDNLIVGDTSGSIVQFSIVGEQSLLGCQTLLSPFDHEPINSCAFSTDSKKLYVLTDGVNFGTFAIFDTVSFQKLRQQRIEFKSELVRMISCTLVNRIFFVMRNSLAQHSVVGEGKEDRGRILKFKWSLKCEAGIKTAIVSSQQNYLAVLVAQSSLHNSKIEIYNLGAPDTHFYKVYWIQENIPASIDLIDFCIDHDYLLFQGPDEEQTVIDLMTRQKIKILSIESQLQWAEEAKKTSRSVADIVSQYSEENKLLRLVQVMNKFMVATDEMGRVRVFSKGILYQICIEHLNEVYICVVNSFNKLIVTVGREDRAMHFWQFTDRS